MAKGDWRYFPVAFAVKTQLVLPLWLAGALCFLWRIEAWMLDPAVYFAISVSGDLDIGSGTCCQSIRFSA